MAVGYGCRVSQGEFDPKVTTGIKGGSEAGAMLMLLVTVRSCFLFYRLSLSPTSVCTE